jgi:hypothetical protein
VLDCENMASLILSHDKIMVVVGFCFCFFSFSFSWIYLDTDKVDEHSKFLKEF